MIKMSYVFLMAERHCINIVNVFKIKLKNLKMLSSANNCFILVNFNPNCSLRPRLAP